MRNKHTNKVTLVHNKPLPDTFIVKERSNCHSPYHIHKTPSDHAIGVTINSVLIYMQEKL